MKKAVLKLIFALLSFASLKTIYFFGEVIGFFLSISPNSIKRNTQINLNLCFPKKSSEQIKYLTKKSLKESSKSALESCKYWDGHNKKDLSLIVEVKGQDLIINSLKEGKGVILFTPHIGNIEILISLIAAKFNCTVPYTPAKIKALDELVKTSRTLMGANMVKADSGGIRSCLKSLYDGNLVLMASDQVPKKGNGIISPFFNLPALSVSLISTMARKTKSPCHSVSCLRKGGGRGFSIIFNKKVKELNDLIVQEGVNLMNRELEECIMKAPEQYAWEYKRFKNSTFKNPY